MPHLEVLTSAGVGMWLELAAASAATEMLASEQWPLTPNARLPRSTSGSYRGHAAPKWAASTPSVSSLAEMALR